MSGWLLILAVLVLGGVLSTLGDRLGSRIGKARLSLFQMRPRRTAVVVTVLTGSLISALTLGLMVAVSERLRVGLFQLDELETRLRSSRKSLQLSLKQLDQNQAELAQARLERAAAEQQLAPLKKQRQELEAERDRLGQDVAARDEELRQLQQRTRRSQQELRQLERNVLYLSSGDVVLSTVQQLNMAKVAIPDPEFARQATEDLLRQANVQAYQRVLPGQKPEKQLLLIPRSEVIKIEKALRSGGPWVVSIHSAGNVLRGEKQVLAFADVRRSRQVLEAGQVLASLSLDPEQRAQKQVLSRLNLLLAVALNESQRRGAFNPLLQVDQYALNDLAAQLVARDGNQPVRLEVLAARDSDSLDPVVVTVRAKGLAPA